MKYGSLSIEFTHLSRRALNTLHRAGIHTIEQMLELDAESLRDLPTYTSVTGVEILNMITQCDPLQNKPFSASVDPANSNNRTNLARPLESAKLSTRSFNALKRSGIHTMGDLLSQNEESLSTIRNLGQKSISEIMDVIERYSSSELDTPLQKQGNTTENLSVSDQQTSDNLAFTPNGFLPISSVHDLFMKTEFIERLMKFVNLHDVQLQDLRVSKEASILLSHYGFESMGDLLLMNQDDLQEFVLIEDKHINEILQLIEDFLSRHGKALISFCNGDDSALWNSRTAADRILGLFDTDNHMRISSRFIEDSLHGELDPDLIEEALSLLVDEGKLEQKNNLYKRKHVKFKDYLDNYPRISERNRAIINKRLQGFTLETIGQEHELTRERARQITNKYTKILLEQYLAQSGSTHFHEDYYRYLYENYDFNPEELSEFLDIPVYIWNYLDINATKKEFKPLEEALKDITNIDPDLRV